LPPAVETFLAAEAISYAQHLLDLLGQFAVLQRIDSKWEGGYLVRKSCSLVP
jgi:hypothetical protein